MKKLSPNSVMPTKELKKIKQSFADNG